MFRWIFQPKNLPGSTALRSWVERRGTAVCQAVRTGSNSYKKQWTGCITSWDCLVGVFLLTCFVVVFPQLDQTIPKIEWQGFLSPNQARKDAHKKGRKGKDFEPKNKINRHFSLVEVWKGVFNLGIKTHHHSLADTFLSTFFRRCHGVHLGANLSAQLSVPSASKDRKRGGPKSGDTDEVSSCSFFFPNRVWNHTRFDLPFERGRILCSA